MDDLHWIWQTIIIFYGGRFILRLAGRKSISQMTITQVIVMIGIGSLLIQPIAGEEIFRTLAVGLLLVLLMVITEFLEVKFDFLETISTGKAKVVVEDGKIDIKQLKKLRMSVDRLETRLRQSGIHSIDDLKYGTIEVNGLIGYELKEHKKPVTKEEFDQLMKEISLIKQALGIDMQLETKLQANESEGIFEEVKKKSNEGEKEP